MSIWFNKTIELVKLKDFTKDTMADFLGMEWTEIGDDFLEISMPVNESTSTMDIAWRRFMCSCRNCG